MNLYGKFGKGTGKKQLKNEDSYGGMEAKRGKKGKLK